MSAFLPYSAWAVGIFAALGALGAEPAATSDHRTAAPSVIFSLERARREQLRQATTAAPYRAALAWPLGEAPAPGRRWLVASAGAEYDHDVTLLSNGLGPPDEIDERDHAGGVWFFEGGGELFRAEGWSGGLLASYWGTAYTDLSGFDTNFPAIGGWIDRRIGTDAAVRARYDFGYAWVDGDSYAASNHFTLSFFKRWDAIGDTRLSAALYYYDFDVPLPTFPREDEPIDGLCASPPAAPSPFPCAPDDYYQGYRRDRDGWGFVIGGEQRRALAINDTELRGGYVYQHYIPDGAEFHNQSHQVWLGATTALPLGVALDGAVSFLYQSYRNYSAFPDPSALEPNAVYALRGIRRHDRIWRVAMALGRPITKNVSASIEYSYTDHDSNYEAFRYDLHRLGGYLTVHFD